MTVDSAVILSAGEGDRLQPLTQYRPKPMLPAGNRPILEHVFDALIDAGIDDIHLVVGYGRDKVQSHFGPSYRGRTIEYHVQEKQLGSGHALLQARSAIDSDFLVINGDEVISSHQIETIVDGHEPGDGVTFGVIESDEAAMYGAVRLSGNRVTEFVEKPQSDGYRLQNVGCYVFTPSIFDEIEATPTEQGELALTDPIARLVRKGDSVRGVRVEGLRCEVTYPWDLIELGSLLLHDRQVSEPERDPGVFVSETAEIHPDATLRAPVAIGKDAVVDAGAIVGPNVALGPNVSVEAATTVVRSVVDADARIDTGSTLIDGIVGAGAVVEPTVSVPGGVGNVRIGQTVHETQRLGCVLADRARLGGGATVVPGVLIGPEATVDSGVVVSENVPERAEVRR
jgi:glucose-1-phosphate thymidylyltransferase